MSVVEKSCWSYALSSSEDQWPLLLPDPSALVRHSPWDEWKEPSGEVGSEGDRLGLWLFDLGMVLWEIQHGFEQPAAVGRYVPADRWLDRALRWLSEHEASPRPAFEDQRSRLGWERRQSGLMCLRAVLLARRHRLRVLSRVRPSQVLDPCRDPEADAAPA